MKFKNEIKSLRKARGLTTVELSRMTGIERSHLSSIENGRRAATLDTLQKIAEALDVPVEYFLVTSIDIKNISNPDIRKFYRSVIPLVKEFVNK